MSVLSANITWYLQRNIDVREPVSPCFSLAIMNKIAIMFVDGWRGAGKLSMGL